MKKLRLLLPVCALLVLFSCNKSASSSGGPNSITATVNGSAKTFNVAANAALTSGAIVIGGSQTANINTALITIAIINNYGSTPVVAGTYAGSAANTAGLQTQITYLQTSDSLAYQDDGTNTDNVIVTVKSITSTNVQGTFSGTLPLLSGTGPAMVKITDGTFNLNIK